MLEQSFFIVLINLHQSSGLLSPALYILVKHSYFFIHTYILWHKNSFSSSWQYSLPLASQSELASYTSGCHGPPPAQNVSDWWRTHNSQKTILNTYPQWVTTVNLLTVPDFSVCNAPPLDVADIVTPLIQSLVQESVTVMCCSSCLLKPVLPLLKHSVQPHRPGTGHTHSLFMQHSLRNILSAWWDISSFAGVYGIW